MGTMRDLIGIQKTQYAASLVERARRATSFRVLHTAAPRLAEPVHDFEGYRLPFIPAQAFNRVTEDTYAPLEPTITGSYAKDFIDDLIKIALGTMMFYYDENGELTVDSSLDSDPEVFDELSIELSTLKQLKAVRDDVAEKNSPLSIAFNA